MSDVTITCWQCEESMTLAQRGDEDGQCPHCGVEVDLEDYLIAAKAEAQALRDEVAALRARVVLVPERFIDDDPDRKYYWGGYNACLDDMAELNGKAVSEGLLREIVRSIDDASWAMQAKPSCQSGVVDRCRCRLCTGTRLGMARNDLNALLGEGKEHE